LGASKDYVKGQLENGIWTNMWAVSPDGKQWYRLTDFQSNVPGVADGYTGPAFTPDGKIAVWSQAMDGNIFAYYPFGRWAMMEADVVIRNGVPALANFKDITPQGMFWNEPGNFAPDGESFVFTGSVEKDAEGMDQYTLNIRTGKLTNLTNSPTVWDEHGVFSPDGKKILFMSAYPYRDDPKASQVLTIKTEFMLMNSDGSGLTQLTHFKTPGYPESSDGIAANGAWSPDGKSLSLRQLFFPRYQDWTITFQGQCAPPPPPAISANGVENGASYQPGIVQNSWIAILGTNLATKTGREQYCHYNDREPVWSSFLFVAWQPGRRHAAGL